MSQFDEINAKQSLAWRLREWGVADADAKAAGFIKDMVANGWVMSPQREARPQHPKPSDACWTCGRAMHDPDAVCDRPETRQQALALKATTGRKATR